MTSSPDEGRDRQPPVADEQAPPVAAADAAATAAAVPGGPVGDSEVEAPLDPATGAAAPEVPESPGDRLVLAERQAEERLLDLQRLQAEYLNYKRRVERDRDLVKENATYAALAPIVEVLDTIDRARESARQTDTELDGGFNSVAEQLERVVATAGLTKYGAAGDPFDPTVHEALSHLGTDPEVTVTTCKVVAKAGYTIGDRVVRAAQVLVVDPADG